MTPTAYIVDDSEVDRYTARRRLTKSQRFDPVLEAADGLGFVDLFLAREAVGAEPKPLVLMDINMPQLDGFATLRALRQRLADLGQGWPLIAVILTSSDAEEDRQRAQDDATVADYMTKPITKEDVERLLRTHYG
mgnify:CR=1 FL=1